MANFDLYSNLEPLAILATNTNSRPVFPSPYTLNNWNYSGYAFKEWNTASDGTGTSYAIGDSTITATASASIFYAIWETHQISVLYKDTIITSLDSSGTKTLLTSGEYCESNISIMYNQPSGSGGTVYQDGDGYIILDPDGEQLTVTQDSTTKVLTIS